MLFFALLPLALSATTLAYHGRSPARRGHYRTHRRDNNNTGSPFTLTDMYKGESFFEGWDFFSNPDPTHGMVNFLDQNSATSANLSYVQPDGVAVLAVDDYTQLPVGSNRNSVRISTKKTFDSGLFIADIVAMPVGCSVWPAWWSVGPNWPEGGEIDIIEGVNNGNLNQYTLHTAEGCTLNNTYSNIRVSTGQVVNTGCASSGANNDGCAFIDTDTRSYGQAFNAIGGGVYAHIWDSNGIRAWHFARDEVPADINAQAPIPGNWGPPSAFWSSSSCDITTHFFDHVLTFDTTLCGDWAGSVYSSSGCPGTCAEAVANATNFADAKWKINYIAVYN